MSKWRPHSMFTHLEHGGMHRSAISSWDSSASKVVGEDVWDWLVGDREEIRRVVDFIDLKALKGIRAALTEDGHLDRHRSNQPGQQRSQWGVRLYKPPFEGAWLEKLKEKKKKKKHTLAFYEVTWGVAVFFGDVCSFVCFCFCFVTFVTRSHVGQDKLPVMSLNCHPAFTSWMLGLQASILMNSLVLAMEHRAPHLLGKHCANRATSSTKIIF